MTNKDSITGYPVYSTKIIRILRTSENIFRCYSGETFDGTTLTV